MSAELVFLLDVDNTLLDNDRVIDDLRRHLQAEFGIANGATVMIGDTSHDLLMASNAGIDALAVTYGAHPHDHLLEHKPVACLHSVRELDGWLLDFA